ncbi:MAG: hypothetical protein GY749_08980 [Desulfobacteraceae bacterium]|nr:hypothetical protein [Desulfobacteraceae bacterium]
MTKDKQLFPIVIDTNVFVHILNPEKNIGKHINQLLATIGSSHELCVDEGGKIAGEYKVILDAIIKNANGLLFEIYLLRYWLKLKPLRKIELNDQQLRTAISKILDKNETADLCFTETAAVSECDLITNDDKHIGNKKKELKRALKKCKYKKTDILSSLEARDKYCS